MRLITFKCKNEVFYAFPVDQIYVYTQDEYLEDDDEDPPEKVTLVCYSDGNSQRSRTVVIDESFDDAVERINDILDPPLPLDPITQDALDRLLNKPKHDPLNPSKRTLSAEATSMQQFQHQEIKTND